MNALLVSRFCKWYCFKDVNALAQCIYLLFDVFFFPFAFYFWKHYPIPYIYSIYVILFTEPLKICICNVFPMHPMQFLALKFTNAFKCYRQLHLGLHFFCMPLLVEARTVTKKNTKHLHFTHLTWSAGKNRPNEEADLT